MTAKQHRLLAWLFRRYMKATGRDRERLGKLLDWALRRAGVC